MKRTFIMLLLVSAAIISSNAQLLFRVSGGGVEKPSYMLGSLHLVSGETLERYDAYLEAEKQCEQLYVEYDITNDQHNKELQSSGLELVMLPDSLTIFEVLGAERAQKLTERMQLTCHVNLTDSAAMQMWHWQPYAFTNMLSLMTTNELFSKVPTLQKLRGKGAPMDATCTIRAKLNGWKVGELDQLARQEELEKTREKMAKSIDEQADSLMALLNNFEERKQTMLHELEKWDKTVLAWIKGDFEEFTSYMSAETDEQPLLFNERNKKWLPRIIEAMNEAPTLFVFGAGHLIQPYGLVHLLREAGYEVEQIKTFKW